MAKKIFHGNFTPDDLAALLICISTVAILKCKRLAQEMRSRCKFGQKGRLNPAGKLRSALSFQAFDDGVIISSGEQQWMGIAASLGYSALAALRNPLSLLGRIDDIAQDIEYLNLEEEIWNVLTSNVKIKGSQYNFLIALRRIVCDYCDTANPVDAPHVSPVARRWAINNQKHAINAAMS